MFYAIVMYIQPVFTGFYLRSVRIQIQTGSRYIGSGWIQVRPGSTKFTRYPAVSRSGSGATLLNVVECILVCLSQFRPVALKQGTETSGSSSGCNSEMPLHTDEVRIENFSLDNKQRRLRQAFVTRFVLFSGYSTTITTVIYVSPGDTCSLHIDFNHCSVHWTSFENENLHFTCLFNFGDF